MTKDWKKHQATILNLYKVQGKTLNEVMKIMEKEYSFKASSVSPCRHSYCKLFMLCVRLMFLGSELGRIALGLIGGMFASTISQHESYPQ